MQDLFPEGQDSPVMGWRSAVLRAVRVRNMQALRYQEELKPLFFGVHKVLAPIF